MTSFKTCMQKWCLLTICVAAINSVVAQRVTVSQDIDSRVLKSYNMLGMVDGNFLLNTVDGRKNIIHSFDKDMQHLYSRELFLEGEKRMDVYAISPTDTSIVVYYGRKKNGLFTLKGSIYNKNLHKLRTDTIYDQEKVKFKLPTFAHSPNKRYTLLYFPFKNTFMRMLLMDNSDARLVWDEVITGKKRAFKDNILELFVSDTGEVHVVIGDHAERDESIFEHIRVVDGKIANTTTAQMTDTFPQDVNVTYNHMRNEIVLAGIYSNNHYSNPAGYFHTTLSADASVKRQSFDYVQFDSKFMIELYGTKLRKKKDLDQFVVRKVIPRIDGGFLLFIEKHKEYIRKEAYRSMSRFRKDIRPPLGVDVYDEDVAVINVHPDGQEFWKRILFKKQFSQDNNKFFSSFFVFKTDSRLRLIYNDEISKNNIVSEYVLNTVGEYERNSLFNTEYQDLKLRFTESVQISSHSFIVPSEHPNHLNLVKIDYTQRL